MLNGVLPTRIRTDECFIPVELSPACMAKCRLAYLVGKLRTVLLKTQQRLPKMKVTNHIRNVIYVEYVEILLAEMMKAGKATCFSNPKLNEWNRESTVWSNHRSG